MTSGKVCVLLALITMSSNACSDGVNGDGRLQAMLLTGQTNKYHNAEIMDRVLAAYLEETGLFDVTVVRSLVNSVWVGDINLYGMRCTTTCRDASGNVDCAFLVLVEDPEFFTGGCKLTCTSLAQSAGAPCYHG